LEPLTLITEIKSLLPARLAGEQHQRPPFSQGQFLQGVVSAKGDAHRFTLEINGLHITAESQAQLQVGQKLDLQVTALTPQVELQIVSNKPINRWLGNVLPLLGQQTHLMPEVTAFAGDSRLMSQLSTTAQETLRFYAGNAGGFGSADALPASVTTARLLDLIGQIAPAPPGQQLQVPNQEISGLLQQLILAPSITAATAEQAAHLAELFAQTAFRQEAAALSPSSPAPASVPVAAGEADTLLAVLEKTPQNVSLTNANTFSQLIALVQEHAILPTAHPLRQLLALLVQIRSEDQPPFNQQGTGPQMEEYINRLGMTMEHLLADNKPEEAVRTLKFALLELSQQAGTAEKTIAAPDQLVQTLELYQLLQIRLANESLLFFPLPFSFLQQGFLLVDADRSGEQSKTGREVNGQADQTVELHLQLEGLGNMQIDIHRHEDRIALKFLTEDTEKAKFIANFRDELEGWIASGSLESVQFLVGAKEPIKTLLEKIMSTNAGMIDTTA